MGEACIGQPDRERLDQVNGLSRHDRRDLSGDCGVVHGLCEVVIAGRRTDVGLDRDVDAEQLPVAALLRMDTVVAAHPQTDQLDPVGGHESDSLGASTGEAWCSHSRQPCARRRKMLVASTFWLPPRPPSGSSMPVRMFSSQVTTAKSPSTSAVTPVRKNWM